MPSKRSSASLPTSTLRNCTTPAAPRPGERLETVAAPEPQPACQRIAHDRLAERMLARLLQAGGDAQQFRLRHAFHGITATTSGRPRVSVPVLSKTIVSTCSSVSSARALRNSTPGLRATAHGDGHRHRRGQPQRAGAGDDQRADGHDQRVRQPRLGTDQRPDDRREQGDADHRRHEPCRNPVRQRLDRRATALRFAHRADDLREQRVVADALGAQHERALAIDRAADQRRRPAPCPPASTLPSASTRPRRRCRRSPCRRPASFRPGAPAAGRRAAPAPGPPPLRGRRPRCARALRGARSSNARSAAPVFCRARNSSTWPSRTSVTIAAADSKYRPAEPPWRNACGISRREQHREHAEAVGHGDTQRNQGEHVETAPAQRMPAPLQQRRAAPERPPAWPAPVAASRRCPAAAPRAASRTCRHRQRDQRHGEDHCPAQPLAHVEQLRVVTRDDDRNRALERHAAVRTGAGHRAGDPGHIGQM